MRLQQALDIIARKVGFRIHWEWAGDGFLRSDYFPDRDEAPIATESAAWELARQFAKATQKSCGGRYSVDVYVIDADSFQPVPYYREQMLNAKEGR